MDGPRQKFRCFSASAEAAFPTVLKARWHNLNILLNHGGAKAGGLQKLIEEDLPRSAKTVRIHVGGDFYSQAYFDAWVNVASARPSIKFYAYTKSIPFWVKRLGDIPPNMVLTASRGGKYDKLIDAYGLKEAIVILDPEEAEAMGIEIDHDDTKAMTDDVQKVALLIHGTQAKGSLAAEAKRNLDKRGVKYSYSRGEAVGS